MLLGSCAKSRYSLASSPSTDPRSFRKSMTKPRIYHFQSQRLCSPLLSHYATSSNNFEKHAIAQLGGTFGHDLILVKQRAGSRKAILKLTGL